MLRAPNQRLFPPLTWDIFLLVFCVCAFSAQANPRLFLVGGLPEGQRQYWSAEQMPGGWVAGTSEGLVVQEGNAWRLIKPPTSNYISAVTRYAEGIVAAGEGFLYLYHNGTWIEKKVDDVFSSAASDGRVALLTGRKSIVAVTREGRLKTLREYPPGGTIRIQRIEKRIFVFPPQDVPKVWDGEKLLDAPELSWALRKNAPLEIISLQRWGEDRMFAVTSRGLASVEHGEIRPLLPDFRKEVASEHWIGGAVDGDTAIVATFFGGIRAVSLASGKTLWRSAATDCGNVYFCQRIENGMLFGTSVGLFVLPSISSYSYADLPAGVFFGPGHNAQGPVLILTTGVVDLHGQPVRTGADRLSGALVLKDGREVWAGVNSVTVNGETIPLSGPPITGVAELGEGLVAGLNINSIQLVDTKVLPRSARVVSIPSGTGNSIARTSPGGGLIGTGDGVITVGPDGVPGQRWGAGPMRVKALSSGAVAMDGQGNMLSESGEKIVSIPQAEILDAEEWRGALWLLVRFADQSIWVGAWDFAARKWVPYDLPVGPAAKALVAGAAGLYVVCDTFVLEVRDLEPLSFPSLRVDVGSDIDVPVPTPAHLRSGVDSVALLLPPFRLGPWNNPSYRVRIDEGRWEPVTTAPHARLTRLGWGESTVDVVQSWAGIEQTTTLKLYRDWPWWGRWPMMVLYGLALGGIGYGAVAWRTRRLHRRALQLEKIVDERTAELRKAQKAREEFFSTISHEIRNPLNGVVGICDILGHLDDSDPRRTRRHVKTLRGCADQLRTILDDVLDFSRIDRGEVQIYDEVFELTAAIDGAARSVDPKMERTTIKLPPNEYWVHGDPGKIRQIVTNLVSNALKYGIPSAAQVFLEVNDVPGEPLPVTVRVRNTGITLEPEQIDKIFTEFVRGQDALKRRIPGSGLGLAVSRRMAMAMKGNLTANSANGLTEFKLTLTLQRGEPVAETPVEQRPPEFGMSRALAIEDEEYNRTVLGFHLAQLGYQVDWAKDGASALQWVKESGYDLILTDFMLPDMTGDELAKQLLKMLPDPKPPIIAVTAYSTPDKIAQAKAAGITGFVTKPVSQKKLSAAILGATTNLEARTPVRQDPVLQCDFSVFERLDDGRRHLAEYAEGLIADWDAIAKECLGQLGQRQMRLAVHTFKSRVLVAHATELAEQLGLLEEAVGESREPDVTRLLSVIRPMVAELASRARDHAFAT